MGGRTRYLYLCDRAGEPVELMERNQAHAEGKWHLIAAALAFTDISLDYTVLQRRQPHKDGLPDIANPRLFMTAAGHVEARRKSADPTTPPVAKTWHDEVAQEMFYEQDAFPPGIVLVPGPRYRFDEDPTRRRGINKEIGHLAYLLWPGALAEGEPESNHAELRYWQERIGEMTVFDESETAHFEVMKTTDLYDLVDRAIRTEGGPRTGRPKAARRELTPQLIQVVKAHRWHLRHLAGYTGNEKPPYAEDKLLLEQGTGHLRAAIRAAHISRYAQTHLDAEHRLI